ncbi:unnamed protein product [Arctia plantaginis]|uniref:FERM domain-containing protein n=1 Tax=Arctia plantaginis TaxID=874455 RepID=A0A8S0ZHI2_ARCPL|nr:unnamed protein product [Arctia plantaginis]
MAPISLKIITNEGAATRKVKFDNKITVRDAHAIIKEKVIVPDPTKEHGLFLRSPDSDRVGIWLEQHRTLDYYMLRDGDSLEYICKIRNLRVKLLDGSIKTLPVDEGKTVSELMVDICGRLNITNYDEYGLCPEEHEEKEDEKEQAPTGTLTLKRLKPQPKERDVTLETLSKKFQTDDNVHWLDQHSTLRELGVEPTDTVIFKRRLFYSDRNVDQRDPVQLNLLYLQTRDAILNGRHLVTEDQDRTKKKYVDADQESNEDFSPDVSEYAPSPGPNILESPLSSASSLSADSACINKIIEFPEIISTPSTISNLSLYLTNADFVASSSEIYIGTLDLSQPSIEKENQSRPNIIRTIISQEDIDDTLKSHETSEINHYETLTGRISNDCSHAKQVVTDNEDSPSLIRKISSEEENNETLRPEGQSESDNDTTLTGRTSNDCSHAKEVVTDGEDSPSLIRKISSEEENNETVRPEGQLQSDNDITMGCGTLSDCSHTATAESEKKHTRKRKLIRTEWRSKKNKILKNSGKAYEGCNSKKKYPEKTIGSPYDAMKATLEEKQRLHLQRKEKVRSLKKEEIETADKAVEFAGIQCQIHYEDFQEEKHKPGFIENLNEFLPETYSSSWGVERKVLKAYRKHHGLSQLEAKNLYIKTARELPTYGVTFFLVKEKQKGKKKLVPRLLGINAEAVLRMDENTKEILQQWPLTHVKSYHVGKSETFALNFGDYSDKEYCCKTQDAFRIRDILEGYIDIIRRRMFARPGPDGGDSMAVCHDNVQSGQIQIIQHIQNQPNKLVKETFVGPNKLVPFDQGSVAQQGTQVMTMQQIIQTNQFNNPQRGLQGEVAQCGQMPTDCVKKLKRMNSCSVKAVTLLAEPTEENINEAQELTKNMQDSLNVVESGLKEIVNQQTIEESQQMLLNEMQDLRNYVKKLSEAIQPGHVNTMEAKDAAEKIVDLTTSLYCAQDFKTRRRSELLNRSKKSFIADEKVDANVRRAHFLVAAADAHAAAQRAHQRLAQRLAPVIRTHTHTHTHTHAHTPPPSARTSASRRSFAHTHTRAHAAAQRAHQRLAQVTRTHTHTHARTPPPSARTSASRRSLAHTHTHIRAHAAAQRAHQRLAQEYSGPVLDEARGRQAELALQDRLAKLNAALALYLTAHSDPNNIDYSAANTSMDTIKELMPELALKGQMLASTKEPSARKALLEDMRTLFEDTLKLCSLTAPEDHEKMQEASNNYADNANKLLFTFSRGRNAEKENELIELARDAGAKTSALLNCASSLSALPPPQAAAMDAAGARGAAAARDLLACAQLTAPAITEPHCQSALTAAAEGLSSSIHQLSATWKPLVEEPSRQQIGEELHQRELDVHRALERLQDAYANLSGADDESLPPRERQRLKFINSLAGARKNLKDLPSTWGTSGAGGNAGAPPGGVKNPALPELKEKAARRRLSQQLAQLNAAVARLARATSDPEKPDYEIAEAALNTIAELMPTIAHDADVVSARQDEGTRDAMRKYITGLCEASQHMFDNLDQLDDLGPAAAKFAASSKKLVFLISPGADKGKEITLNELSSAAYDKSSAVVAQAMAVQEQLRGPPAAELCARAARAQLAARALVTVAQVTAPSIDEPSCSNALAEALQELQNCINEVAAACYPHIKPGSKEYAGLQDSHRQLEDSVEKIAQVAQLDLSKDVEMTEAVHPDTALAAQREKKRLQFVNSMPEAKKRLDAAEQQMKEPLACVMMKAEDAAVLQRQLEDRLAQLNAAVAALARATSDRENPDYEGAQRAVDTITRLMPEFVQDTCVLGATKSGDTQNKLAQQLQQLCDASRAICDSAGQAQGLNEAAVKFSDASGKLLFLVSPGGSQEKDKEIIELASDSCLRASELLSQVQGLTQRVPGEEGVELDKRGARTADAAQALLTTAQLTAPTIASPQCSSALISAAEQLRSSAKDLTNSCQPHLQPGHQEQLELQNSDELLENSLYKLVQACKEAPRRKPQPPPQLDKQRLKFTNSVSEAKSCFDDVQQQLQQPVVCALMREEDAAALQQQLSDRLAQLNAAIAALATATADRLHPDYASAQRAVNTITALMPELVRDSKTLSGTKAGDAQQDMLQQVQQLCDASRAVCANAAEPQALSESAAKFSDASGKLMFTISPSSDNLKEKQIIDLSSVACVRASELLSRVQALTQRIPGEEGEELDKRGAKTADAAQALLTTAHVTAPSIASPHCSAALVSAAEQLRNSAKSLTDSCQPHLNPGQQDQLELQNSEQQLEDSLNSLVQACKETARRKPPVPPKHEKGRLQFMNSLSETKRCLDDVQQQLQQPVVCALMREEDAAALQQQLSDRLAQLNAAIAALATATADRSHPDYASAQRAVNTITALMPELVRDSRTLSGTKAGDAQQDMLQQVQQLCEASRVICDNAGEARALSEAAAKFSDASGKLMFTISPAPDNLKEKQIIDLTSDACVRASELLSRVQALTQRIPGEEGEELDRRGAKTADAAQALLTTAQVTAPSIGSPPCAAALVSAAEQLRSSAKNLTTSCQTHLRPGHREKLELQDSEQQLENSLNKLVQACKETPRRKAPAPPQKDKQRLQFVNSLSGAKTCFDDVQQQLKRPVVCALMREEDAAALQQQLSDRLAQLNAAIAALATATADRSHPDYASAQQAVDTITALMPELVRDARTLSGTKSGPEQDKLVRQVQQLCDASKAICNDAGQPQGLSEAATKFSAASHELMCNVTPARAASRQTKQQQVIDLSSTSCARASELLSQVQALTQQVEGSAATDLDTRGAKTADAAQALLSVAQVTAPSLNSAQCRKALELAVQKLRGSAADLTDACDPHLKHGAQRQHLLETHHQLNDDLDKLLQASDVPLSKEQQEKQRLHFINSLSGAKNRFNDVQQQLKQPVICALMREEDAAALQHQLSDRLAQLNAAIAMLAAATADRSHPDYASAQRAVDTITALMPELVRDARTLSATKSGPEQHKMVQQVQQLCDASKALCDDAGQPQGLSEAATKFSAASHELMCNVAPARAASLQTKQQQVVDLSAASCARTSELLSQVQALTRQIEGSAASDLDARGASTADAAQALLSVAQVTAPSLSSQHCRKALESAVHKLRGSAADLTDACHPHLKHGAQRHQLFDTHQQLNDDLDKLLQASGVPLSREQQEKQRLHFINSLSGIKNCFDDVQQQLKQPVTHSMLPQEEQMNLQRRLGARLAQLNATIAQLAVATSDRSHPDYASAQRAVDTITALLPELVRDAKTLSATREGTARQDTLQQVRHLCDASRAICESAAEPQELHKAVTQLAEASDSMMSAIQPVADCGKRKQIGDMSAVACSHASELLSQAQALTKQLHGDVAADLASRVARTADAKQTLLAVAQVTAPSINSSQCQKALESAVQKLKDSAAELTEACDPHVKSGAQRKELLDTQQHLEDNLDMLLHSSGCKGVVSPALQEKMRDRFKRCVSVVRPQIEAAQKQVKEVSRGQWAGGAGGGPVGRHQARRHLAQLDSAAAALAAASADHENPDYPTAERSLITICELMPIVVQESKALSCTRDDDHQQLVQENLKVLCDASRRICDSADEPKKLNESSLEFAKASSKLMVSVRPESEQLDAAGGKTKGPQKPSVPVRSTKTVAHAVPSRNSITTQNFLDALRTEEDYDNEARIVAAQSKTDEEKSQLQQFTRAVDAAEKEIEAVENSLKALHKAKITCDLAPLEVITKEQKIEDTLARAGIEVAALISANYAHKLDYAAAEEPTLGLGNSVRTIVEDGSKICGALPKEMQRSFIDDLSGLSGAARSICRAARYDKEKLNDAAIAFGNHSAKLLHVVSANVNPGLEKEVIVRARAIGDSASRLAMDATNVANNSANISANMPANKSPHGEQSRVQDICAAGAQCVDAAGKLVYTAKLVAPTIHHTSCKEALASSADTLAAKLATFSDTWQPFASDPHSKKLTEESKNLTKLMEKLKDDVKSERGKRRDIDRLVVVDTPLRQMTVQIIDNARTMVEHGDLSPDAKQEYREYHSRLAEALRALDLANARCQRAPHDKYRRNEMDIAIQDVQMMALQTRPSRAGQEPNNIVDFRDFLQGLATESDNLARTADKHSVVVDKRVVDDIKLLCSKISDDARRLMNPTQHTGYDSYEDMMEIYEFGQECDHLTKELNSMIRSIPESKSRSALHAKLLHVAENSNFLRFATNSALSTAKSAAFEATLQDLDDFQNTVIKVIGTQRRQQERERAQCPWRAGRAWSRLVRAARGAGRGEQQALRPALASCCLSAHEPRLCTAPNDDLFSCLSGIAGGLQHYTEISCLQSANWMKHDETDSTSPLVQEINKTGSLLKKKPEIEVVRDEDIESLLSTQGHKVEGTRNQVEEKFQQLSTKLSSMSGSVFQSVKNPEALARSLRASAAAAAQLAGAARALRDTQKPIQSKKIEDATHEMCLATYDLLNTSEVLCQNPDHHDTRRRLLEACYHVNDSVNKLNRAVYPEPKIARESNELLRVLQLQKCALQSAVQPAASSPYAHCIDALHSQRDLLLKMNSDQAMSREEFLKSMLFITTAVTNSTECAAHATYLLAVSENDKSVATEGLIDVPKMKKSIAAIHDTCVSIILDPVEQVREERRTLEKQVEELIKDLDESEERTKDQDVKIMLKKHRKEVQLSSQSLYNVINQKKPADVVISFALCLDDDIGRLSHALEHPALVPTAGQLSQGTQALCDDVLKHSTDLVTNTQELIKEIKSTPEQSEVLKWTSFSKRKDVLNAFDALLKSIKSSGQNINVLEADEEASEQKSYVQIQTDTAFKWLHKPMAKSDVKANGQQAVKNLIDIGNKMAEDLEGADKEDMRHVVEETEQLLKHCTKKYDQEQYSLLMERIRELKKAIERMAVTRVVEDFMDAEQPLADLDILADAERDEKNRNFLLERKIAELLAQLGRMSKTARFIADTGNAGPNVSSQLRTCSEQTELLAPMLVKAAQERVHKPDDTAVIENYKALLARYTESLSKVRDLCDQSVDPMDFVLTAGETMQRMRDDSINEDPMKCALTSVAITKLANRVIHVGLSSRSARADPELQRALAEAQHQLSAATPAPDTRASNIPDWRDTTAKILHATGKVESVLGGEAIFNKEPDTDQPIYNEALNLHVAIRDWSSRDNEIVAVAKRMAVLMAKLSAYMNTDKQHEVLTTSKSIVAESHEVARLAKKLAHECTDHRIKTNLLQVCERIPTISGQLKMLTTVKGYSLGHHGTQEDKEAMDMLVGNAQSLMISIQDVVKAAASASVKIMSQRGARIKWVRKTYY